MFADIFVENFSGPIALLLVAGLLGYVVTFALDTLQDYRQARLKYVNEQLKDLYGPLLTLTSDLNGNWTAFRRKHAIGREGFLNSTPTPTQLDIWREWIVTVFMPANRRIRRTIIQNAHLMVENDMPDCMLQMCAHASSYEVLLARWNKGDRTEHRSHVDFPDELHQHVLGHYRELKREQSRLSGRWLGRTKPTEHPSDAINTAAWFRTTLSEQPPG